MRAMREHEVLGARHSPLGRVSDKLRTYASVFMWLMRARSWTAAGVHWKLSNFTASEFSLDSRPDGEIVNVRVWRATRIGHAHVSARALLENRIILTVGVKLLPPPVVSGGFVGQVKPRGGSKNCGFALGFNPPPWFQENLLDMSNRGGGVIWHPR